jgi:hypothetical protein
MIVTHRRHPHHDRDGDRIPHGEIPRRVRSDGFAPLRLGAPYARKSHGVWNQAVSSCSPRTRLADCANQAKVRRGSTPSPKGHRSWGLQSVMRRSLIRKILSTSASVTIFASRYPRRPCDPLLPSTSYVRISITTSNASANQTRLARSPPTTLSGRGSLRAGVDPR